MQDPLMLKCCKPHWCTFTGAALKTHCRGQLQTSSRIMQGLASVRIHRNMVWNCAVGKCALSAAAWRTLTCSAAGLQCLLLCLQQQGAHMSVAATTPTGAGSRMDLAHEQLDFTKSVGKAGVLMAFSCVPCFHKC